MASRWVWQGRSSLVLLAVDVAENSTWSQVFGQLDSILMKRLTGISKLVIRCVPNTNLLFSVWASLTMVFVKI